MAEIDTAPEEEEIVNPHLNLPVAELVQALRTNKNQLTVLNSEVEGLKADQKLIEEALIALGKSTGMSEFKTSAGKIIIGEEQIFAVKDWEKLHQYIHENRAFHLLQRRANNAPMRELSNMGTELPGVEPFTRKKVGLRQA